MAETTAQPPAHPSNGTEAAGDSDAAAREQRKKKRNKLIVYLALFIILQTAIFTVFNLTVMKVRTPKFRMNYATLINFNGGSPSSPSVRATMTVEFSVKNSNFGRYKFGNTTVEFTYRGSKVGEVVVPESRAKWRSTRQFRVDVDLNVVSTDLREGVITISSSAVIKGRVDLLWVLRKNRDTHLNCSMDIVTQRITNITCD